MRRADRLFLIIHALQGRRTALPARRLAETLCLAFWGGVWTLGAWCRLRNDFRNFRPDRIGAFEATGEVFVETAQRGFAAYLRAAGAGTEFLND